MHYLSPSFLFTHHIQRGQSDEIISKIVLIGQEGGIGFIRLFENCQLLKKTLFYFFVIMIIPRMKETCVMIWTWRLFFTMPFGDVSDRKLLSAMEHISLPIKYCNQ